MHANLTEIINTMTQVVIFATPIALVLLLFFWNMSQLIFQSGNAEKIKDARARILWSIIGLFVLFSLAGILVILQNTLFGTSNQNNGAFNQQSIGQTTGGSSNSGNVFGGGNAGNTGGRPAQGLRGCALDPNPDQFCSQLNDSDPVYTGYTCNTSTGNCVPGARRSGPATNCIPGIDPNCAI